MSYEIFLKDLLRPLGVYRLDGTLNSAELESVGLALDQARNQLEHLEQEMNPATAVDDGLDLLEKILPLKPLTNDLARRRAALAALLRIGGDSFTQEDISDSLVGCGVNAVIGQGEKRQTVEIKFPGVLGIPNNLDELKVSIESIIPCHLDIQYCFYFTSWNTLQNLFATWAELDCLSLSWADMEKKV